MLYQRSLGIERRLQTVLTLIEAGDYSAAKLANKVGVSIPTISRDVTALRQRGHKICAERHGIVWRFRLLSRTKENTSAGGAIRRRPR